jgi:hypothetical protein
VYIGELGSYGVCGRKRKNTGLPSAIRQLLLPYKIIKNKKIPPTT